LWAWIVPPAQINQAELILGAVIRKSEMFNRFPLSAEDANLVAHGYSGEGRFPYGSIATSFTAYGATSLMIMQDLSAKEIEKTLAEIAADESKGH